VVLAASYEAREFGVRGGMPGRKARELCPTIQFVGGHFPEYQRLGDAVIAVLDDFTPLVERVSIDEAFLDVSGSVHLFGPPRRIAVRIRERVSNEIGLRLSIGVARTKHLAKVASQVAKPDGLVVVEPSDEQVFLDPLPVGLIWGVGRVTEERLRQAGIVTIGQLASTASPILEHLLGVVNSAKLVSLAASIDPRRVGTARRSKSVGAQAALGRQLAAPPLVRDTLGFLADRVAGRLRECDQGGRTVTVRVRFPGLRSVTRSITLGAPVSATLSLTELANQLVDSALTDHPDEREITLLAISVSNLCNETPVQLELPLPLRTAGVVDSPSSATGLARRDTDRSVDAIRQKFGRTSVGYAAVLFSNGRRVPDEFRELVEHPTRR